MVEYEVGDVVLVQYSGYGFGDYDLNKYVVITEYVKHGYMGNGGVCVKEYDKPLLSISTQKGVESFGGTPMILCNINESIKTLDEPINKEDSAQEEGLANKYMREIKPGVWVDVYDVLHAFVVTNPALQHLIKKALAVGQRGHKDASEDYQDIIDSSVRAKQLHEEWNEKDSGD